MLLVLTTAVLLVASSASPGGQSTALVESWLRPGLHEGDRCSEFGTFVMGHGMRFRELSVIVSRMTSKGTTDPVRKCRFWNPDARSRSGNPERRLFKTRTQRPGQFLVRVGHTWDEHRTCAGGTLVIRRSLSEARFLITSKRCDEQVISVSAEESEVNVELQCRGQ